MPSGRKCKHPNCEGGPCKALTQDELTPTAEDRALAEQLVADGWIQVSAKYRMLLRWKEPPPTAEQLLNPIYENTYFAKEAVRWLGNAVGEHALRMAPKEMVEERQLSPREFKAYKELKNKPWRDMIKRHREEAKAAGRTPNL